MRTRTLLSCVCLTTCAFPSRAQFSSAKPTPPAFSLPTTPYDSRTQLSPKWLSDRTATAKARAQAMASLRQVQPLILAQNNFVCYAMRSYNFAPDSPSSERNNYKGTTYCEPAKHAHIMTMGGPVIP